MQFLIFKSYNFKILISYALPDNAAHSTQKMIPTSKQNNYLNGRLRSSQTEASYQKGLAQSYVIAYI